FPSGKPQPNPTYNAIYNLPTIENSTERGRLDSQHTALRIALGSLYAGHDYVKLRLAPKKEGTQPRILDVGTGSGICNTPPNCRFGYLNANDGFTSLGQSFDAIHMRSVGAGIRDQVRLVRDVARVLKPGGVFLWAGGDIKLYTENYEPLPRVEEGEEGWKQGRNVRDINEFKTLLEDSEYFTYRGHEDAFCPVGTWKEGGCVPLDCVSVGGAYTWFAATDTPKTA
ncbi:hypothetical protein FRC00_008736, partial [Tulasnella sp. 408]